MDHTNTENEMRYRLQDDMNRAWDAEESKWQNLTTGYSTYKTINQAVAAGRRTKSSRFLNASNVQAVKDTPPTEWR